MPAILRFDQGASIGDDNRSRSDIVAGTAVNIKNVSPGVTQNDIALLWKPPEDDTAAISGISPDWTIVPKAGTSGTYTVKLTVDGNISIHTFTTLTPILELPILAANEKADPTASLIKNTSTEIDAAETNEAFGPFTSGSAFGWWRHLDRWFRKLEDLFNPSSGHDHSGSGASGAQLDHDDLQNVTENQHHNRQHAFDSGLDHSGALPESYITFSPTGHKHTGGAEGQIINHSDLNDDEPQKHRLINDAGSSSTELWSSQKIEAEITAISSSYNRRRACIDLVDCTAAPPTESTGDRYILDFTAGTVDPNWDGAAKGDIVEFNGSTWDATTPSEGWVSYVDLLNKDALYVDDGTPEWELRNVYSRLHSDLTDVTPNQHHNQVHAFAGADHTASTLAQVNTKISDATLDDVTGTRDPNAHDLAGAVHNSATLAQLNAKVSDATLVDKDSANSWTAKQTFAHSTPATTASANLLPYNADPSSPAAGDIILTGPSHPSGPGAIRSYNGTGWNEAGLAGADWKATVTGAGPHNLEKNRYNKFDDSAGAGMVLNLPSSPADNDEVFLKEVGNSSNEVTLSGGTDDLEKIDGTIGTSDILNTARQVLGYKWNNTDSVWRIINRYIPAGEAEPELRFTADIKTANYIALHGDFVRVNPTGGSFTVYAPASPQKGDRFGVKNTTSNTTAVTVDGNGNLLDWASTRTVNQAYQWRVFQYDGTQWAEEDAGGSLMEFTATKTALYTAAVNEIVLADPSGGVFQVNAPASPVKDDRFGVKNDTSSTNAITINGNGNNLDGSGTLPINQAYQWRVFQYDGSEWREVDGGGYVLDFDGIKTANYTAVAGERVRYNPTGGTFTIYAPASPVKDDEFGTKNNTTNTTAITIDGNGKNLDGSATRAANQASEWRTWKYNGTQWNEIGA